MLRTRLTLQPGQPGTRKLVEEYGPRLVCVRYRYDDVQRKRYKTVELIVEEVDWLRRARRPAATEIVHVRVAYAERAVRNSVKLFGGIWHPETRSWKIAYGAAVALQLTDRIIDPAAPAISTPIHTAPSPVDTPGVDRE